MKYIYLLWGMIRKLAILIWKTMSIFFGFPYEEQAKKLKDYDARGKSNPKRKNRVNRPNKVSKK